MNYLQNFSSFISDIVKHRRVLWGLAKNDFKARFASSFLGILWAFIQPLVTILVFWFVYQVGFKTSPMNNVPFIIWFIPAYLVWSFFSESLISATNCLREYGYLVRKVNFRVSMIPLVKIISSTFVHIVFIGFIFFMCFVYSIPASIYNLQVIYYFICTIILLVGLGWLLSSITIFMPDMSNIVNVFIQIGFWATPIFWSPDKMSTKVQMVLKLNPMFYICRGYRDCFVDHVWFWDRGLTNLNFWAITAVLFVLGAIVFRRLRPHFADLL